MAAPRQRPKFFARTDPRVTQTDPRQETPHE